MCSAIMLFVDPLDLLDSAPQIPLNVKILELGIGIQTISGNRVPSSGDGHEGVGEDPVDLLSPVKNSS